MSYSGPEITVSASLSRSIRQMQRSLDSRLEALSRRVTPLTVHACRTQARRLRAILRTFKHAFNPTELARYENVLRRLTRELAPLRCADVELQVIERLARDRSIPKEDGLEEVRAIAAHARSRALWDLEAKLIGGAWLGRLERMRQTASDPQLIIESQAPMAVMALRILSRQRRRLRRQFRTHKPSPKALHKRRLKIKTLRYLLERCAPDNAAVRAELKQLRLLQDWLGEFHDEWTLRRRLARQSPHLRATIDIRFQLRWHRVEILRSIEKHQHHLLRIWKDTPPHGVRDPRAAEIA